MKLSAWIPVLLFLMASPADGTLAAKPDPAAIERDLQPMVQVRGEAERRTLVEAMRAHRVPAVSIAVVDHGRIVWARAYGLADIAAQRRANTNTLFQAASISKPVAASGALRLVESGRLSLDAPLNSTLKGWQLPDSGAGTGASVGLVPGTG